MQLVTTDGVRQQRSIHFETRQGTSIVNSQSPAIAECQRAYFPWFQNKYPKVRSIVAIPQASTTAMVLSLRRAGPRYTVLKRSIRF